MLDKLRGLLPGGGDEDELEPLTAGERRRLEHRERRLRREVKRLEKSLDGVHCSTCAKQPVSSGAVALSKRVKEARSELREVQHRLDEAPEA